MNNYQQQILGIFGVAQQSIKVAISWFTDEVLIEALIEKASSGVKVDVLLSADLVNLWRFKKMNQLSDAGAIIRKRGSENALMGNFMHSKLVLIDDKTAFGGGYNFTANARTNNENFGQYTTCTNFFNDYMQWWSNSSDFLGGWTEDQAKKIIESLKEQSVEDQKRREALTNKLLQEVKNSSSNERMYQNAVLSMSIPQPSERDNVIQAELKKDELRNTANTLISQNASINGKGQVVSQKTGVVSQPHKFYGGTIGVLSTINSSKKTYAVAAFQKHHIESKYDFLKCEIKNGTLICIGELQPENCNKYKIRIEFREGIAPKVFILSPHIEPKAAIHIYSEGSLCLFYPKEFKWTDTTKIADYATPQFSDNELR
jgi:membrane-associated HD superfamily phosphohydrolase